ncbi:PQQ-binding-like beta-propeller repeat protein [Thiohalorhabdus methylotrophus]|uniref:PQQ-binding-like beta-propeller repeat protein n=1 Tax=Thiohalorhabdus methylotrophus TaxID=3242694 RepID=A0ABV4TUB4_9GAMM
MNRSILLSAVLLGLLVLGGCASPGKRVWPAPDGAAGAPDQSGAPLFIFRTGGAVRGAPALGPGGKVYLASRDGHVYAVSPSGAKEWAYELGAADGEAAVAVAPDGRIYAAAGGRVHALSPDGERRWVYATRGTVRGAPVPGPDGTLYVASADDATKKDDGYTYPVDHLHAVTPRGERKWVREAAGGVAAPPAVAPGGTVYLATRDGGVHALNPDGDRKWSRAVPGPLSASPAVGPEGAVYVGSKEGRLHALTAAGERRWTQEMGGAVTAAPAVAPDGTVYAGSGDGRIHALTPAGEEKWTYATDGPVATTPAVGPDGTVYAGSDDGFLYALTPDGTRRWARGTGEPVRSSPVIGPGDRVYVGSDSRRLYAWRGWPEWVARFPADPPEARGRFRWRAGHGHPAPHTDGTSLATVRQLAERRFRHALATYRRLPPDLRERQWRLALARPLPPRLAKDEFESSRRFRERLDRARKAYRQSVEDHNRRVSELETAIRGFRRDRRRLPAWKREQILRRTFLEVLGDPELRDIRYDADSRTFYGEIVANRGGGLQRTVALKRAVSPEAARRLKPRLQRVDPEVTFEVGDDGGLEWADAAVAVDGTRYALLPTGAPAPVDVRVRVAGPAPERVDLTGLRVRGAGEDLDLTVTRDPEIRALQERIVQARERIAAERLKERRLARLKERLAELQGRRGADAAPNARTRELLEGLPEAARPRPHGVAVIIGNRHYGGADSDIPDVRYAHNDARAMARFARRTLGFRAGNVVVLEDASKARLEAWLGSASHPGGRLADLVKPGRSEVFVYYSGHGVPGAREGRSHLLPVDASPDQVAITGYALTTLYRNLSQLPAKRVTVALDACFSGRSPGGAVVRNASPATLTVKGVRPGLAGGTVLAAAAPEQIASWDTEARLGLFTRYWLKGVSGAADADGDRRVTAGELHDFLGERVTYQARRRYGRVQEPRLFGPPERVVAELP